MNRISSVKHYLYKITCCIMCFFFGLIFLQTTANSGHMEVLSSLLTGIRKPLFLLGGALLLTFLLTRLSHTLHQASDKTQKMVLILFAVIGISLQLALILGLQPCLQYDALKPVDTAIAMLKGTPLAATEYYKYFSSYPHNVPLTLYIMCIFKIAGVFGVSESSYILLLQLINCLLFDFALIHIFRMLKNIYGRPLALSFGLLCFFNPLLYYYPVFFYTQVLSIPLFVLLITVFFKVINADSLKHRIFYGACYGVILFFGWKIRFFTLITLIACGMFLLFRQPIHKPDYKKLFGISFSILFSFFICFAANEFLMEKYTVHTEKTQAFPVHHWIMMGLQGDGTFYYADEDFTSAFPGKDSRIEENTRIIKERLDHLGLGGLLQLWGRKLNITWSDGIDDYASNLTLVKNYGPLNDFLTGYRSEFLAAYLHIYNCMIWMFLTRCAVKLFKKKYADFIYAICITVLGGILFHLIWEAGEPYSMPFVFLILGGASFGMESLTTPVSEKKFKKYTNRAALGILAAFSVCILSIAPSLASTAVPVTEMAAIQNLVGGEFLYLTSGDTITQTFLASREFNTLTLRYKYYEESEGEVLATMLLYDQNGTCLTEQVMPMPDAVTLIDFTFPAISPNGTEEYTIELSAAKVPDSSKIGFTAYNTGNWDTYKHGHLFQNGIEVPQADICFELTNQCSRTLF